MATIGEKVENGRMPAGSMARLGLHLAPSF